MDNKIVIAYYGNLHSPRAKLDFSDWWREQEDIASKLRLRLTNVSAAFIKKPSSLKEDNAYSLPRSQKKFEQEVKKRNVKRLCFESMISKPRGYLAFDWDYSSWLGSNHNEYYEMHVGIDMKHVKGSKIDLLHEIMEQFFQSSMKRLRLEYGFSAIMERDFGPTGYAVGLPVGGAPDFLCYDAHAWRKFAGKKCGRRIRNVFGYNLLNRKHLNMRVGDVNLEEWINKSPQRGKLKNIDDNLFVWSFAKNRNDAAFLAWDYPAVVKARKELEKHKIFPWQKYKLN